jgi:serine protease AprX
VLERDRHFTYDDRGMRGRELGAYTDMTSTTALVLPRMSTARPREPARGLLLGLAAIILAASFARPWPIVPDPWPKVDPALVAEAGSAPTSTLQVIVREMTPASSDAEDTVRSLGGGIGRELPIVGGFSARIPAASLADLAASGSVAKVWGDARVDVSGDKTGKYDSTAPNSVWRQVIRVPGATEKYNGSGVGVALLDTGVVPVPDLANRVAYRVDLTPEADGYDRYGHGTHLAGIIAGDGTSSNGGNRGIATGANLISVKVAGWNGATDVSVVIAGLQWIVSHRADYNIRVANLSFGTNSKQPYALDPLDYAVEQAWFSGILVVVSAGNQGSLPGTITKPADDPYVLTVGAADLKNTLDVKDDTVADFSSVGPTQDGFAKPDVLAPGITIVSDRDPGSTIDQLHPVAILNDNYFKGTGTSQAAAIVSGVAALMFQASPTLTPDVAKATLMGTAFEKNLALLPGGGAGLINAEEAVKAAVAGKFFLKPANVGVIPSTGLGSLEASRGSLHVYADLDGDGLPDLVTGEIDVLGRVWVANGWGANSWGANAWGGSSWSANGWGANSWGGMAWDANSWGANGWGANSWGANGWGANSWGANAWGANSWGANAWGAHTWS